MPADVIRQKIEGAIAYLTEHPDEARYTDSVATARIVDGLRVRVEGPDGMTVETDMPESVGGTKTAPSPGWLFRASLASCVATTIAMRAAVEGVSIEGLEVTVDSESDDRGLLGMDPAVPAGPFGISVRVQATADVPPDRLREIVQSGHDLCPVCDSAKRAVPVELRVNE